MEVGKARHRVRPAPSLPANPLAALDSSGRAGGIRTRDLLNPHQEGRKFWAFGQEWTGEAVSGQSAGMAVFIMICEQSASGQERTGVDLNFFAGIYNGIYSAPCAVELGKLGPPKEASS